MAITNDIMNGVCVFNIQYKFDLNDTPNWYNDRYWPFHRPVDQGQPNQQLEAVHSCRPCSIILGWQVSERAKLRAKFSIHGYIYY